MGKMSGFLLLCLFLTTFVTSAHSEGSDLESKYDGMLPPAVIEYLKDNPMEEQEVSTTVAPLMAGPKVLDGVDAVSGEFPHQVYLKRPDKGIMSHFCGASVIHPFLLVCAAHCFKEKNENITATAGEHIVGGSLEPGHVKQVRDVIHVYIHKNYNASTWDNDIAILVLNEPLDFNSSNVKPIQLRDPSWKLPDRAKLSGYGVTKMSGGSSTVLQAAEIPFVSHENCIERVKPRNTITENMVCAGANGSDACTGDSGGPLTCAREGANGSEEYYLCGIVSWGFPCGSSKGKLPSMYTDVTKYIGWIRKFTRTWWRHYWLTIFGKPRAGRSECDNGKFKCPNNGLCILNEFICDGENDCDPVDNWDERNCSSIITCAKGQFKCSSTQTCIPSNYVCDGDEDCEDKTDEQGCEE